MDRAANLDALLEAWANDPRIFQIADKISLSVPQQISLQNLQGSSAAFLLAAVFGHKAAAGLNHLVICEDAEDAAYFHNSLEGITQALDLFYFPSSFKNKRNYQLLNSSHVMLRTEALTKIAAGGNKKILITYPEAVFEKVVVGKALSSNIISIKQAETIAVDSILELLVMLGFKRTDFVYEPGQFAVRGGILDIYSYGNEKPYRIELFGNEVDSIRIFDPETQLSERKLLQVSIIPNVDTQFETADKVPLLEFLPGNAVVWTTDWQFISERLQQEQEDLENFLGWLRTNPQQQAPPEEEVIDTDSVLKQVTEADFTTPEVFAQQLALRHQV
ncbi:MAG TPA: transcription-repair coupling factor, partial [Phnomibacter sp.]|nr:transcription-repair coupling factor [Phnomibacter sp.]